MIYFTDSYCIRAATLSLSIASIFSASPAQAFTLADSQGTFSFTNFSTAPLSTNTSTLTDTFSAGNSTAAIANADALFVVLPNPQAGNLISNSAFGNSVFGSAAIAQSEASIIGDFAIGAGETFSFDFFGAIDLFTSTQQPTDFATALLNMQYSVLAFEPNTATFNELDFLTLFGEISTPNGADSLFIDNSSAITLTQLSILDNTGATRTTEAISAQIAGRYERLFSQPTALTLAEFKLGAAAIETQNLKQVPTPDIAITWWVGVVGAIALRKRGLLKNWLRPKN